eukprot:2109247-Pleurochrysis_carterae.AAC.8
MLARPVSGSYHALKNSPRSSAIADGGGLDFLKNRRVGDMPAYEAKQLFGAQVAGTFALDVLVRCLSSGLAASGVAMHG